MQRKIPVNLPEGYVEFYQKLETWQNEQQIKLKKEETPEVIDLQKFITNSSKPVISAINFKVDAIRFKALYMDLLQFLKENRPEIAAVIDKITENADQFDFEELAVNVAANEQESIVELANRLGIPHELFYFTLDHALRPYLRVFASPYYEKFTDANLPDSSSNTCPFCGCKSHFSRIRMDDSVRFMFCDRCFTEWSVRFLYCVHCGNDQPGTIRYINMEDDAAYQIYTCDKCKGYIKSYDEREAGKMTDLFIANIETIYLDMLAREKGYTNHDED